MYVWFVNLKVRISVLQLHNNNSCVNSVKYIESLTDRIGKNTQMNKTVNVFSYVINCDDKLRRPWATRSFLFTHLAIVQAVATKKPPRHCYDARSSGVCMCISSSKSRIKYFYVNHIKQNTKIKRGKVLINSNLWPFLLFYLFVFTFYIELNDFVFLLFVLNVWNLKLVSIIHFVWCKFNFIYYFIKLYFIFLCSFLFA